MTTHKKIMHLIATNFYGGPEKQILEHLRRLNVDNYRGVLASFIEGGRPNEILRRADGCGLRHFAIAMSCPFDLRAMGDLMSLLFTEKVHLLCTHGYKSTIMGWCAAKIMKIPIVVFSRGYTAENKKVAFYEWLERQFLSFVDYIVTVSEGQRQRLQVLGVNCRRSSVVYNAVSINQTDEDMVEVEPSSVLSSLDIEEGSRLVVAAGRLSPEKGHRFLIEAVAELGPKANGTCFVFCGDGVCQKSLLDQAKLLGVADKCRFPGFRHDIESIFQVMDLAVLPSLTEGLPNVVLEAFAFAKPVIATAVGGVPEVVDDGINGFLVPPGRSDLLAEAIGKCLAEPQKAREMGHRGYHKVKREFSFTSQTKQLESIYSELLT